MSMHFDNNPISSSWSLYTRHTDELYSTVVNQIFLRRVTSDTREKLYTVQLPETVFCHKIRVPKNNKGMHYFLGDK